MSDLPVNRDAIADYNLGPRPERAPSKAAFWTGWVLTALAGLMLLMGGVMDIAKAQVAVDGLARVGFPPGAIVPLGVVTVISVVLYLLPQTVLLGAILLTGYLGGAVVVHLQLNELGLMAAPVFFGVIVWLGPLLREPRLRVLLPLRKR